MITVRRAGLAVVTDLGRPGLARHGIPAGGAADQYSAVVANVLAGNAEGDPLIEVTASDFTFTADRAALVAVAGAPATVTVGQRLARAWEPVCVAAHEQVSITGIHAGLRVYVAVNGLWGVPRVFGSCAPNTQLGVGTWLRTGSQVTVRTDYCPIDHPVFRLPVFALGARPPRFGSPWTIDVTTGPDSAEVTAATETLASATYTVRPDSDHIGLRLAGPVPRRTATTEMLSKGVPAGAVAGVTARPSGHRGLSGSRGRDPGRPIRARPGQARPDHPVPALHGRRGRRGAAAAAAQPRRARRPCPHGVREREHSAPDRGQIWINGTAVEHRIEETGCDDGDDEGFGAVRSATYGVS